MKAAKKAFRAVDLHADSNLPLPPDFPADGLHASGHNSACFRYPDIIRPGYAHRYHHAICYRYLHPHTRANRDIHAPAQRGQP